MGLAISKCEASPPDPTILPPPPPPPGGGSAGSGQGPPGSPEGPPINEKYKHNPGTYEELSKKCKGN